MQINKHYKFFSIILIFLSISSFFIGFIQGENSAGAGTLNNDFVNVWTNLQTFLNNDLNRAIQFTAVADRDHYVSSRTPLIYILNSLFNPFVETKITFIKSIFIFSLTAPIFFYLCLQQKFKKEDKLLLMLITSTICLSPYFRTSAYWGLEENFGIVSVLFAFFFIDKFLSYDSSSLNKYFNLFLSIFFSSLCLYFDQKLLIIPLICFLKIFFSDESSNFKIFSIFFYFIFSLPYIYLIINWGNIIPTGDAGGRGVLNQLHFYHIGYTATMIAFYLFPLLLFKNNFFKMINKFFLKKENYYLIFLFIIYLLYLIFFHEYEKESIVGKGFIHKLSLLIFETILLQKIFIYFSFLASWLIILIYFNENFKDKMIITYFFILSIFLWPIQQEYFDPLILILAFTFFNTELIINYKNSILLFLYLSILLISSNFYYYNLLN